MKTITGKWQSDSGASLAGDILRLKLSQDAVVPGSSQVAPVMIEITLDDTGAIPANTQIWANDELEPTPTYYTATVRSKRQGLQWGPQILSITGASPINLNTVVPVAEPQVAVGPSTQIDLQTNSVDNPVQNKLNLKPGSNVTLTADDAGGVTIAASSSISSSFDGIASGTNTSSDMVVGSGASLSASGTGVINATEINGTPITGTPALGQIPIGQGDGTAAFADPFVQGVYLPDTNVTTGGIGAGPIKPVLVGGKGADGTLKDISTDNSGQVNVVVQNLPATQPVSGAVSVTNFPATQPISGTVAVSNFPASSSAVELLDAGGTNKASISVDGAVKVDGSAVTQPVSGTVAVSNLPATQPISAVSLPLPAGAATAAKQPALGTAGSPSADVITVQGAASMTPVKVDGSGVTQPVSLAAAITAKLEDGSGNAITSTASALDVNVKSAGTVAVKEVPQTSGGLGLPFSASVAGAATAVKTSAGQIYALWVLNNASAVSYIQCFNKAAANVTLGTTVPDFVIPLPANVGGVVSLPAGCAFSTALTIACTTTRTGATGATVDVLMWVA